MSDQPRRPVFFWLVILTCVVYAGLFAFTVYAVVRYYGVEKAPGWRASTDGTNWFVSDVDEAGPAAGRVQVGDRLLAINGDERRTVFGLFEWSFVDGGKPYRLDLERRGERVSLELPMPLVPGQQLTPIFALVGLAFFICGAALALLRPQDGQVRLAGAFLMSAGFATLHQTLQPIFGFLVGWEQIAQLGVVPLSLWTFPLAYHFFTRFPVGRSPGSLWRFIQWLLYAVFVLVIWPAWFYIYLARSLFGNGTRFLFAHAWLFPAACYVINSGIFVYMVICFVLAIVLTARNYHHLRDRDSRRRIKLVVAGVMIALIPFVGLTFAFNVAEWIRPQTYGLYYPLSFLAMLGIPVSIGAAVRKDQLFDIRVLVRRGLQYLFAKVALRTLLVLPIALLAFSILSNPNRTIAQIVTQGSGWLNVVWIGAAAATLYWRRRVQTWLDRRFFREDYQQEQVLVHLIDEIRQRDSVAEIAQLVTARIDSVLHPTALHIFYRAKEDSEFVSGRSASQSASQPPSQQVLSEQQTLERVMDEAPTQQHLACGTTSTDILIVNPVQAANAGGQDVYLAKVDAAGAAALFSTYLGGTGNEFAYATAVDNMGGIYLTGDAGSTDFPTAGPLQVTFGGGGTDAFVSKIAPDNQLTSLDPARVWIGLKNSDDVGTKFDLLAEVFKNAGLVGSGQLDGVSGGSSGFNNAVLRTINLAVSSPVNVGPG